MLSHPLESPCDFGALLLLSVAETGKTTSHARGYHSMSFEIGIPSRSGKIIQDRENFISGSENPIQEQKLPTRSGKFGKLNRAENVSVQ